MAGFHRREGQSSSLAPNSKAKTDGEGEKSSKTSEVAEMKALQTKGAKFRADTKIVRTCHVNVGTFPCVKTTSLRPNALMEEHVSSDMLRLKKSPAKSQRKVVRKDQLHHSRSLYN